MFTTYASLLDELVKCRDSNEYRNEPDHDRARRDNLEFIVQTMLEKLVRRDPQ